MKIGILTFHRTINYGSFLQCYSLMSAIKNSGDNKVEVIDFNMKSAEKVRYLELVSKNPIKVIKRIKKFNVFNKHINNELPLTKKKLISDDMNEAIKFINEQNYDVVVVGSDEVWKITKLRGFPNIFWLSDQLNCRMFSYAASLNKSERLPNTLNESKKEYIKKTLEAYDYIGVRDTLTFNELTAIDSNLKLRMNSDPTFLYPMNKGVNTSLRERLQTKYKLDLNKPMIGLMTENVEVGKVLKETYGDSYKIVSFHINNEYSDIFIYDLNPYEFAEIFSIFRIAVTSFFHGTIFSIKNNIPFISIENNPKYKIYKSKIYDILNRNGLGDRYCYMNDDSFTMEEFISKVDKLLKQEEKCNYNSIIEQGQTIFEEFASKLND